jgi:SulP family sulfate permease
MKKIIDFKYFKYDILGGITAGIVALPLALAFGEQSGLGAGAGLYGAAFIAFFAALFGGTATQISGPTAPMTALSMVVVAGLLEVYEGRVEEALPLILMVFVLAGVFQILLGVLKLGTYIRYIPYTVVSGFMTGIGLIILITQIPPALGYYTANDAEVVEGFKPHAEELILDRILLEEAQDGILVLEEFKETMSRAEEVTEEDIHIEAEILAANDGKGVYGAIEYLPNALKKINYVELILALLTILIKYGFKKISRKVPGTLVALLVVSASAYFLKLDYVRIQEIPAGYPAFHFDIFTQFSFTSFAPYIVSALLLALLGAIDSLLTSVVADNLTKTSHKPNKELIGQGIGNGIAAMFGGLVGAGATIRTVVNIQAGGKTRLSGMVAGLLLFAIVIMLGPIASMIPAAVLAGILITVGFGVMDYKGLKALPRMEFAEKVILITVLLLTVFWQLVYAVALGLVFASFVFLKRMSDISSSNVVINDLTRALPEDPLWEDEIKISPEIREKVIFKHLNGPLFFGFVTHFKNLVSDLPDIHLLVIRMEKVPFIDQSGVYALESAIEELHKLDVVVSLSGVNEQAKGILKDMKLIPQLVPDRFVFEDFASCSRWLKEILKSEDGLEKELAFLHQQLK